MRWRKARAASRQIGPCLSPRARPGRRWVVHCRDRSTLADGVVAKRGCHGSGLYRAALESRTSRIRASTRRASAKSAGRGYSRTTTSQTSRWDRRYGSCWMCCSPLVGQDVGEALGWAHEQTDLRRDGSVDR
jgi:hypothetical protein